MSSLASSSQQASPSILDAELPVKVMMKVSESIGRRWKNFGMVLVSPEIIENIELNYYSEGVEEMAMQVLLSWKRSNPQATVNMLLDKLKDEHVKEMNLVRIIKKMLVKEEVEDETKKTGDKLLADHPEVRQDVMLAIGRLWKNLGRLLKISEDELDNIANKPNREVTEKADEVLRTWINKYSEQADFYTLRRALSTLGRKDIANKIWR